MARVTVEDCLEQIPNRFALTILGSRRARALSEGKGTAQVQSTNKAGVVALREIAKGLVRYDEDVEETIRTFIEEQRAHLVAGTNIDATFIDAASFGTDDEDDDDDDDDDIKELSADPDKLIVDDDDDSDSDSGSGSGSDAPEGTEPIADSSGDGDGVDASVAVDTLDDDTDDDDDDDDAGDDTPPAG